MVDVARVVVHGEQLRGAEEIDDTVDAAVSIQVFADLSLQVIDIARDTEHRDKVPTCGTAPDGDVVRIQVMFFRMGADPANGSFAIVDLCRPLRLSTESVADGDARVFTAFDKGCKPPVAGALVSSSPGATMDKGNHRQRLAIAFADLWQ